MSENPGSIDSHPDPAERAPQPFIWPVRVYYEDTDAMGVVYYANYLKFFERARTEWLRVSNVHQRELAAGQHLQFVVRAANMDYLAPARLDDSLQIFLTTKKLGRTSVVFYHEVWRMTTNTVNTAGFEAKSAPDLLATAEVTIVCVDTNAMRPRAIPTTISEKLRAIAAGSKMLNSGSGDFLKKSV